MFSGIHPVAIIAIIAAVLLIIAYVLYKKRNPDYHDIEVPKPEKLRQGILYGYYASVKPEDFDNTKDHSNLFWYCSFFGFNNQTYEVDESVIDIFRRTNDKILLELSAWVTTWSDPDPDKRKQILHPEAEMRVRQIFTQLRNAGVLNKINYLAINDEPPLHTINKEEHLKMIQIAKSVAQEFPELGGVKWVCIYLNFEDFWNIEHFDVVGVDSYKQKSEVLTKGEHARLVKELRPGQTTLIIPGCSFGQEPEPFANWAHLNDNVEMVVPFLYFADPNHKTEFIGLEARDPAFRQRWIDAAHFIMQR